MNKYIEILPLELRDGEGTLIGKQLRELKELGFV